jgi:hypothetical protein
LIALLIFSPVLYWNATHDWVSFRFQLDRPAQLQSWSIKFLGEFLGVQFALLSPILFPALLYAVVRLGGRGLLKGDPIEVLLSMCVIVPMGFLVWRSFYGRIGDSWPLFVRPFGLACIAINLKPGRDVQGQLDRSRSLCWTATIAVSGIAIVVGTTERLRTTR